MKRDILRSLLFNAGFYVATAICCVICLPTLLLPRKTLLVIIRLYLYIITALEYGLMNLRYEVRGLEHLPEDGSFIIAAKHMSAYETLKLRLIFKDPAIVLKKELTQIPLWGTYLAKSGVIAIDRSTPAKAAKSIEDGAKDIMEQKRPIIIFPQGTRVRPEETAKDKPYKPGVWRIQKTTGLPVVPLATNSGLFWPRSGWLKSSGTVIFEILKPIPPQKDKGTLMKKLEKNIEGASKKLMDEQMDEQREENKAGKKRSLILPLLAVLLIVIAAVYTVLWFEMAKDIQSRYPGILAGLETPETQKTRVAPKITGFPGPLKFHIAKEGIQTREGFMGIQDMNVSVWPIPGLPVHMETGPVTIRHFRWGQPLNFDRTQASFTALGNSVYIKESDLQYRDFRASLAGTIDTAQKPFPKLSLELTMRNHSEIIMELAERKILQEREALFITAGFSALADEEGVIRLPVTQKDNRVYAGPLPVFTVPEETLPGSTLPAMPIARKHTVPVE